jgi:4-hydroxy-tetrahydrodipicolinate synthase
MTAFAPGLAHAPVTPFTRDHAVDWNTYGKLLDFHLANGAQALALPMHVGESVSLSDEEQRKLVRFAVERAAGKVPVIAHASDSGTSIAAARAEHAQKAGAAAIVVTTPYYWTPPAKMLEEHFEEVAKAVTIPVYAWYAPEEMAGPKITTDIVLKLIERAPNFAGVVDSSNDWQFQINVLSNAQRVRADFQLVCGTEYMVSGGANGATSMFSALAGIAPVLVKRLYDICRKEQYAEACGTQEQVAALRKILKAYGFGALKAALRARGRDCGEPRPPMEGLDEVARGELLAQLERCEALAAEPRGW